MKRKETEKKSEGSAKMSEGQTEPCDLCSGTGLVCRNPPVIDSKNCCVDWANAVCPACKGSGIRRDDEPSPE